MANSMGLDYGLTPANGKLCKKKWRWMFKIPDVCGIDAKGVDVLPPRSAARPDLKWKEMNIQHLSEEVFFPGKPEWSILSLSLYDIKEAKHPVMVWLRKMYRVDKTDSQMFKAAAGFIKECRLELYDGCGSVIEKWVFEDAWPQSMNFQTLDMGSNELVMCDIVLRYARAYIDEAYDDYNTSNNWSGATCANDQATYV
jgi:hypothetical protein